jgi:hypothetical protein
MKLRELGDGWHVITTRRTVKWRGKRMVITDSRLCGLVFSKPQTIYFSAVADPLSWDEEIAWFDNGS